MILSGPELAKRSDRDKLDREQRVVASWSCLQSLLEPMPNIVMILNEHRQIVFSNRALLNTLGVTGLDDILGMRPGECLNCERANESPAGCGTADACQSCGALKAIVAGQNGKEETQECLMLISDCKPLSLQVKVFPVHINDSHFTLLCATDIGDEKCRQNLERIFFHDIMNHAGAIEGFIDYLESLAEGNDETKQCLLMVKNATENMIETIKSQKDLLAAEKNALSVYISSLHSLHILNEVLEIYAKHSCAKDRFMNIDYSAESVIFDSDHRLLLRVLGNLIKNALEASEPGQTVSVNCTSESDQVCFHIHNQAVIPENVQHQIFRRSFSQKSKDRGLGTYSVKLLTEQYLKGSVSFISNDQQGTIFTVSLPLKCVY